MGDPGSSLIPVGHYVLGSQSQLLSLRWPHDCDLGRGVGRPISHQAVGRLSRIIDTSIAGIFARGGDITAPNHADGGALFTVMLPR